MECTSVIGFKTQSLDLMMVISIGGREFQPVEIEVSIGSWRWILS